MDTHGNSITIAALEGPLMGSVRVPGDKSISHRAVLFSAMAQGTSRLSGVLDSDDVRSSVRAVQQLGASVNLEKWRTEALRAALRGGGRRAQSSPMLPSTAATRGRLPDSSWAFSPPGNAR